MSRKQLVLFSNKTVLKQYTVKPHQYAPVNKQGSTVNIKSPYVITHVCQNFAVRDVRGQILKNIYQASYLLPSDFPRNFS